MHSIFTAASALFIASLLPLLGTGILYVDPDATGANDGSSWQDAFTSLDGALAAATANDQVWVREGEYTPNDTGDRADSFNIPNKVEIYGGFNGTETTLNERDHEANETILAGTTRTDAMQDDPVTWVRSLVNLNGVEAGTILDGFILEKATANGASGPDANGGLCYAVNSTFSFQNCTFREATASGSGACIYTENSNAEIQNCGFSNASAASGSAVYCDGGSLNATANSFEDSDNAVETLNCAAFVVDNFWRNCEGTVVKCTGGSLEAESSYWSDCGVAGDPADCLLEVGNGCDANLDSCIFDQNICENVIRNQGILSLINTLVTRNDTETGAVLNTPASGGCTIEYCTVADNTSNNAQSEGTSVNDDSPAELKIFNTVMIAVWDDTNPPADADAAGKVNVSNLSGPEDIRNNVFFPFEDSVNVSPTPPPIEDLNFNSDASSPTEAYHPGRHTSVADAGNDSLGTTPDTDLNGNPRGHDGNSDGKAGLDIGAIESNLSDYIDDPMVDDYPSILTMGDQCLEPGDRLAIRFVVEDDLPRVTVTLTTNTGDLIVRRKDSNIEAQYNLFDFSSSGVSLVGITYDLNGINTGEYCVTYVAPPHADNDIVEIEVVDDVGQRDIVSFAVTIKESTDVQETTALVDGDTTEPIWTSPVPDTIRGAGDLVAAQVDEGKDLVVGMDDFEVLRFNGAPDVTVTIADNRALQMEGDSGAWPNEPPAIDDIKLVMQGESRVLVPGGILQIVGSTVTDEVPADNPVIFDTSGGDSLLSAILSEFTNVEFLNFEELELVATDINFDDGQSHDFTGANQVDFFASSNLTASESGTLVEVDSELDMINPVLVTNDTPPEEIPNTLSATNGGRMLFRDNFDSTGGLLKAKDGTFEASGSINENPVISKAQIELLLDSTFSVNSPGFVTFDHCTFELEGTSQFVIQNGGSASLNGVVANLESGTRIWVDGLNDTTWITVGEVNIIQGEGQFETSDGAQNRIQGTGSNPELVMKTQMRLGNVRMDDHSLVTVELVEVSGNVDLRLNEFTANDQIEVIAGGDLAFHNFPLSLMGQDGELTVRDGGRATYHNGFRCEGGTINVDPGGESLVAGDATFVGNSLSGDWEVSERGVFTIEDSIELEDGTEVSVLGAGTNTTVQVDDTGSGALVETATGGSAKILLTKSKSFFIAKDASDQITLMSGLVVCGRGNFGFLNSGNFIIQEGASVQADGAFGSGDLNVNAQSVHVDGHLGADDGGILDVGSVPITLGITGSIVASNAGTVALSSATAVNGSGTIDGGEDGSLVKIGGSVTGNSPSEKLSLTGSIFAQDGASLENVEYDDVDLQIDGAVMVDDIAGTGSITPMDDNATVGSFSSTYSLFGVSASGGGSWHGMVNLGSTMTSAAGRNHNIDPGPSANDFTIAPKGIIVAIEPNSSVTIQKNTCVDGAVDIGPDSHLDLGNNDLDLGSGGTANLQGQWTGNGARFSLGSSASMGGRGNVQNTTVAGAMKLGSSPGHYHTTGNFVFEAPGRSRSKWPGLAACAELTSTPSLRMAT